MKVLTWNMNKASSSPWAKSSAKKWESFLEMKPDVAMLQEVNGVPDAVSESYHVGYVKASFLGGYEAKFGTAVLTRKSDWTMGSEVAWNSEHDWVNRIQKRFPGWLVGRQVEHRSGDRYMAVSVHSPAWPVWWCSKECEEEGKSASCKLPEICEILDGVDVTPVKLEAKWQRWLWFTEILWSLLKGATAGDGASKWIVAGDFNSSVLFDKPRNKGNGEIIDRLNALGLFDCVFRHHRKHEPTYRAFRGRKRKPPQPPVHQLDYVYVSAPVLARLSGVALGGGLPEKDKWRSDHLPVVCDFR